MKNNTLLLFLIIFLVFYLFSYAKATVVEIVIEYQPGPSLQVEIVNPPTSAQPNQQIALSSKVTNVGTANASAPCLEWILPSGWVINTGTKTVCISGQLKPNDLMWNNITVTTGSTTGSFLVTARANCSEGVEGSASTTINIINCPNGVCDPGETCSNCPSDCSCPGSPGCCGSLCGCPPGQVCENDVCKTPSYPPPPGCDPRTDWACCVNTYPQGCCDCPSLGYTACGYRPFNQSYGDCKKVCMEVCPGGCSVFTSSASCLNAGCRWCNGVCQKERCADCTIFTNVASCLNAGCEWCEGRCKDKCLLNWTFTIDAYIESFVNEPINGSIKVKNDGEVSIHDITLHFIEVPKEINYQFTPTSYSLISPRETKTFVVTYTPTATGTYDVRINISSRELYHFAKVTLNVKEREKYPELFTWMTLLWIIMGMIILLTIASYLRYLQKKKRRIAETMKKERLETKLETETEEESETEGQSET